MTENLDLIEKQLSEIGNELFDSFELYRKLIENEFDAVGYSAFVGYTVFILNGRKENFRYQAEIKISPDDPLIKATREVEYLKHSFLKKILNNS
ncbi:hypothetical protein [Sphingobacterium spiritivorum]|uniref:hypothetical protein n=1 Tax=Sphingobacterium spiritivorum TaxID=258 RepID=UPI003DA3DD5D